MINLTEYKLCDLYRMDSGIGTSKEQAGHGSPFVSFSDIFNNIILPSELTQKMETTIEEQEKYSIRKGDILLTRTSETVDELAMSSVALKDYPQATFSGFAKRLRPIQNNITYDKYMAFLLRSKYFRDIINAKTIMTLRASFNEDIFRDIKILLPEYSVQVIIGDFLYNIEKKIQVNNKIINELKTILKTIYDYWFLQFEFPDNNGNPYKSMGGKTIFNSELKREIPVDWDVKQLKDICNIDLGGTPKTQILEFWNGDILWLNSGEVAQFPVIKSEMKITKLGLENSATKLMKKGTTVVSITGNIRTSILGKDMCANQSVVGISENDILKKSYLYPFITDTIDYYKRISSGNCQQHINKKTIEDTFVLLPENDVLDKYYKICEEFYEQIITLSLESEELESIRDFLLPILMNGQVKL